MNADEQAQQSEELSLEGLPKLGVFYVDGVPSYTCMTCDLALGDTAEAREHLLSAHAETGTRHMKQTLGFACGRKSMRR